MNMIANISGMVTDSQMSMFGQVFRFYNDDPVHRIINCSDFLGEKTLTDPTSRGRGRWMFTSEGLGPIILFLVLNQE